MIFLNFKKIFYWKRGGFLKKDNFFYNKNSKVYFENMLEYAEVGLLIFCDIGAKFQRSHQAGSRGECI